MVTGDFGANGLNIKEMITKCTKVKWNHELQVKGFSQAVKLTCTCTLALNICFHQKLLLCYSTHNKMAGDRDNKN